MSYLGWRDIVNECRQNQGAGIGRRRSSGLSGGREGWWGEGQHVQVSQTKERIECIEHLREGGQGNWNLENDKWVLGDEPWRIRGFLSGL